MPAQRAPLPDLSSAADCTTDTNARRRFRRDPGEIRQLMAEPGALPLGVAAGVALAAFGRLLDRDLAAQMPDQPRHAVRLHRRQQRIEPARGERAAPRRARRPRASRRSARRCGDRARARSAARKILTARAASSDRRHALAVPVGERAAGRQHDLERAGDARAVVRHQPLRAADRGAAARHSSGATPSASSRARTRADVGRDRRHRREPLRQRLEIEPGAADQDRQPPGAR